MKYELKCTRCGTELTVEQPMSANLDKHCDVCNDNTLERVYDATPAHFYGPGFYSHDYKRQVWAKGH